MNPRAGEAINRQDSDTIGRSPRPGAELLQILVDTMKENAILILDSKGYTVRYIGARVVLTGVRPAIAQTLVHLGVDLSIATTRASLAAGLRVAFGLLNLRVATEADTQT